MQTGLEKFLSWNKAKSSSSTSPGATWTPINTRETAKEERQMKRITMRAENRTTGGCRCSSGISTSLTRTRTFSNFHLWPSCTPLWQVRQENFRHPLFWKSWIRNASERVYVFADAHDQQRKWDRSFVGDRITQTGKRRTRLNPRKVEANLAGILTSKITHRPWILSDAKRDVKSLSKRHKK